MTSLSMISTQASCGYANSLFPKIIVGFLGIRIVLLSFGIEYRCKRLAGLFVTSGTSRIKFKVSFVPYAFTVMAFSQK